MMIINKEVDDYPVSSTMLEDEEGQEQDSYNRVLKDINSSLKKHRKSSARSKKRKPQTSLSSQRIDSQSNFDGLTHSSTKPTLEHSPSTGALKRSASKVTLR